MSEKKDLDDKHFLPETLKKSFLEKYDHIPLSKKEKLLDRDFGYKSIDELVDAFNNTDSSS